jgi:hypothetical protein
VPSGLTMKSLLSFHFSFESTTEPISRFSFLLLSILLISKDLMEGIEMTSEECEREEAVLKRLEERGIPFVLHRHPRVFTCGMCDLVYACPQ